MRDHGKPAFMIVDFEELSVYVHAPRVQLILREHRLLEILFFLFRRVL